MRVHLGRASGLCPNLQCPNFERHIFLFKRSWDSWEEFLHPYCPFPECKQPLTVVDSEFEFNPQAEIFNEVRMEYNYHGRSYRNLLILHANNLQGESFLCRMPNICSEKAATTRAQNLMAHLLSNREIFAQLTEHPANTNLILPLFDTPTVISWDSSSEDYQSQMRHAAARLQRISEIYNQGRML